jgi:phosphoribosylglycinamide formyltransferase 2
MTLAFPPVLGTPGSPSATRVMLLGCGELGKEVIIALQRLGVEVIAVDRYDNDPGHQVAQRSQTIDMSDGNVLARLIDSEKPDYVVPEIEAIATATLLELEKTGVCTVIPSARAAHLTMNREGIRRLAAEELKLPTSSYAFADSLKELRIAVEGKDGIGYPCVVKPVMSSSGKGQSKVDDYEITLLTVRAKDANGQIETHFCEPIGHRQVKGDYVESWQPQPMSAKALKEARRIAKTVTDNLGGQGLFGVEFFIKGDAVWFSEVSPRPHDTGMVTMATQRQSEFELHARAILGLPVDTRLRNPGASAVIYGGSESKGLRYEGVDEALRVPSTDLRLFGKPESFHRRRMGVALAEGKDVDEARARAKEAAGKIRPVAG